ncbi:MAG: phytanoyl-CoA dioxygenase family protein, partial [Pirellulales bacterium]
MNVLQSQLDVYQETGYLVLRGLFSGEEMAALAGECDSLLQRTDLIHSDNLRCRFQPHENGSPCLFETFDPVVDIAPQCAAVAADRRVHEVLEQIYEDDACLFKDKLIFKPPGARGYGLHQDYIAWKNFPRSFITVLVAIDAADQENGCTVVYPGYHLKGCLTTEDGDYHELPESAV